MDELFDASALERVIKEYDTIDEGRHEFLEIEDWGVMHLIIKNPLGLHARPSTEVCKITLRYQGGIYIIKKGSAEKASDAKSISSLLLLAADFDSNLYFFYDLSDPEKARKNAHELKALFEGNFGIP